MRNFQKLERFLKKFPNDAKSWKQATDEIMDCARVVRMYYNGHVLDVIEGDEGYIQGLNAKGMKSPAEFNQAYKTQILELWPNLTPTLRERVIDRFC